MDFLCSHNCRSGCNPIEAMVAKFKAQGHPPRFGGKFTAVFGKPRNINEDGSCGIGGIARKDGCIPITFYVVRHPNWFMCIYSQMYKRRLSSNYQKVGLISSILNFKFLNFFIKFIF